MNPQLTRVLMVVTAVALAVLSQQTAVVGDAGEWVFSAAGVLFGWAQKAPGHGRG